MSINLKKHTVVFTLFEGDKYSLGVGALLNSLIRSGFKGNFIVGLRGELPRWSSKLNFSALEESKEISEGVFLEFKEVSFPHCLTMYKAHFALELIRDREIDKIYYFDPDITVCAPWSFFDQWVESGVALCEDVFSPIFKNSPIREDWRKLLIDLPLKNEIEICINAGFIGLNNTDFALLELWKKANEEVLGLKDCSQVSSGRRFFDSLPSLDQDALNRSIEVYTGRLSVLNKSAMGFDGYDHIVMNHAINKIKPWDKNYLKSFFINCQPPIKSDVDFINNLYFFIEVLPFYQVLYLKFSRRLASFLSRFYHRSN